MNCLQIKCPCGHFGRVFDPETFHRYTKDQNPGVRCSNCGAVVGLEIRRAWISSGNPLDGARADRDTSDP